MIILFVYVNMQKAFFKLWSLITWLWVNQKQNYPGWSWPNQARPLQEIQGLPWGQRDSSAGLEEVKWPSYERIVEGVIRQEPKEGLRNWEWSLTGSQQENQELSPIITRNRIFPTNTWAWKKSLSSRKEASLEDTLMWHSVITQPCDTLRTGSH